MTHLANEDMLINFMNTGGPGCIYTVDQPIDPIKIVPVKDTKWKINKKFVCVTNITLLFSVPMPCPFTAPGHTFVAGGGVIMAGAKAHTAGKQKLLVQDDMGNCAGSWINTASGATVACACMVKIANAGQTYWKEK